MKLVVIQYGGEPQHIECESFEFRTNHVANWIRVKYADGTREMIDNVCVIKTDSEVANESNS